jgi:hypothetical protein
MVASREAPEQPPAQDVRAVEITHPTIVHDQ